MRCLIKHSGTLCMIDLIFLHDNNSKAFIHSLAENKIPRNSNNGLYTCQTGRCWRETIARTEIETIFQVKCALTTCCSTKTRAITISGWKFHRRETSFPISSSITTLFTFIVVGSSPITVIRPKSSPSVQMATIYLDSSVATSQKLPQHQCLFGLIRNKWCSWKCIASYNYVLNLMTGCVWFDQRTHFTFTISLLVFSKRYLLPSMELLIVFEPNSYVVHEPQLNSI